MNKRSYYIKNKKRILFLDFDDVKNPLLGAGQAFATKEVGSKLSKKGYKVVSLCSRYPGYKDRLEHGVYYKHIGLGSSSVKLNNLVYLLAVPLALMTTKADLVIECFTAPVSTLFSPLFTKAPVVALPSMFNAEEFTKKYGLPFDKVEKFGMKFYKYIMAYSDVDNEKAKRLNPNIISKIIPQGVSKKYFQIKKTEPQHILFLSRFDITQKGIDLLVESYAKIADKVSYPLVIAGHGPDEKKIRKMISELGLMNKVQIAGPAYGEKKYKLMSEALFVAFPSRHDEMCLWALEALAVGLPLICFDIPESSWLNQKISLKAKPFDTDEYAKLLYKASTEDFVWGMRTESRKFAKKFDWQKVTNQFDHFFNQVLEMESEKALVKSVKPSLVGNE